jgi:hypothetical protein
LPFVGSAEKDPSHLHVSAFQGVQHGVHLSALQCNARLLGDPSDVDRPDEEFGSVRNQYCGAEGNVSSAPVVNDCSAQQLRVLAFTACAQRTQSGQ